MIVVKRKAEQSVPAVKSNNAKMCALYRAAITDLFLSHHHNEPANWGQLESQWGGDDTPTTSLVPEIANFTFSRAHNNQ